MRACDYRVLVVEDEPRLRQLMVAELPAMGFHPVAVPTAELAWAALQKSPADIVLLDLNLPGIGGLEFLQQLRSQHPDIPVVVMTAYGDLESARQAIRFGVVDFLTKPSRLQEIEQALERARLRVEAANAPPTEPAAPAPTTLADAERKLILEALDRHGGNRSAAACELGISRRTLYNKLAGMG